jgi:hypothetical protein
MQFFVDNAQTIFTLAGALVLYIYHQVAVHVPAEKRKYAERFAASAVAFVAQQYAGRSNEEKKAIAMATAKEFFKTFDLPAPDDEVLSKLIEAAVNALPPDIPPAKEWRPN